MLAGPDGVLCRAHRLEPFHGCLAVSVSSGISVQGLRPVHIVRLSCYSGLLQFILPATGWFLGKTLAVYIEAYDPWIALSFLGAMMLKCLFSKPVSAPQSADVVQERGDR
ncbi:putative manganese efflux pump MntP [Hollandina sp. SP2]